MQLRLQIRSCARHHRLVPLPVKITSNASAVFGPPLPQHRSQHVAAADIDFRAPAIATVFNPVLNWPCQQLLHVHATLLHAPPRNQQCTCNWM